MRNNIIRFRMDDFELDILDAFCSNHKLKRSKFVRDVVLDYAVNESDRKYVSREEEYKILKKLVYEINKIGTNINQIARNVNSEIYLESDKQKLLSCLNEIYFLLKKKEN